MSDHALPARLTREAAQRTRDKLEDALGGPARTRVVVLFACVLALESADLAAVGASAPQLERSLHISNTEIGLLAAISTFVGALATVPFGALTDRLRRVPLLAGAIVLWAAAMVASATAQSYDWLLLSRLGLGAVTAAAGPLVASLTGDFFAASERGKIYGYVLSGELLGAGFGFVVSGSVASALSWRGAFGVLAIPALALAVAIWRMLPEPARGGQSRLAPGDEHIVSAEEAADDGGSGGADTARQEAASGTAGGTAGKPVVDDGGEIARRAVAEQDVDPARERVLDEDPRHMRIGRAIRYILEIPTIRWLIIASSVGYFFFAGMRTFALAFVRGHFELSQGTATLFLFLIGLGALGAVLISGRLADRLIRRGHLTARITVPAIAYIAAAVLLIPSLLVTQVAIAVPLLILAGAGLSAPNPPLDAARLDIVPALLWGRAEGVRTLIRQTAQAAAPILFGVLADVLGGGHGTAFSSGKHLSPSSTRGLQYAFLIMLVPLALNGIALLMARGGYPEDVATALRSERRLAEAREGGEGPGPEGDGPRAHDEECAGDEVNERLRSGRSGPLRRRRRRPASR